MSAPAALWPAWLREELAAHPGRWRLAIVISACGTLALGVALGLQIASFPAPLIAFKAALPSIVCTWRNLLLRVAVIVVAALLVIPTVGVLVQVPWLLLPVFFAAVSALTYFAPVERSPIRGYCAALTVGAMSFTAVFAPYDLGYTALSLSGGFTIGLIIATVVAELRRTDHPHDHLSRALSDAFARSRAELRAAAARYCAAPASSSAGSAVHDERRTPHASSGALAQHLQLLDRVRQEHHGPELERAFVALITAADRIAMYISLADTLAWQTTPHQYRQLVDAELGALLDAIDFALARFTAAASHPVDIISFDAAPTARAGPWPDFHQLVAALRARQHSLLDSGLTAAVGVEESENLNAFTQALAGLADVLDIPPEALEHVAPEPAPARLPVFDPYAAQFAMKIGLGCVVALAVGVASHVQALEVIILSPLLLAQGSYGATIRRAGLRVAGVVVGGLLAVLTVVSVMPNTNDAAIWLLVLFAVLLPCAYIALGTPRFSYFGLQVAITYLIVLVAERPEVDIHKVLWRFFGTLLGSAILLGVFQILLPDYAGRQIVSRFGDLLRTLLAIVPELDRPLPPVAQTQRSGEAMVTALADVLRLAEEARYERDDSGIDRDAAVDAAGVLRRVAHRWALVRRSRRQPRPPLPVALHDAIGALENALRVHLRTLLELIEARHHRARPGSATHRAAHAAAAAVAARPRPDLQAPLNRLEEAAAAARRDELPSWPTDAASSLLAEIGHLHRLVELTPALGASLVRMSLRTTPAPAVVTVAALQPATEPGAQ